MRTGAALGAISPVLAVDPSKVGAGTTAFVIVALLAVALILLLRSLNKQLGKIDFERPEDDWGDTRERRRSKRGRVRGPAKPPGNSDTGSSPPREQ
jgi:hypothetical protein